ncbi:MAG: hypothetical protein HY548_02625, partial [Elusimicrobia bacterium]|nr:hypothetical protein [Elusimicrobiota bacterium]
GETRELLKNAEAKNVRVTYDERTDSVSLKFEIGGRENVQGLLKSLEVKDADVALAKLGGRINLEGLTFQADVRLDAQGKIVEGTLTAKGSFDRLVKEKSVREGNVGELATTFGLALELTIRFVAKGEMSVTTKVVANAAQVERMLSSEEGKLEKALGGDFGLLVDVIRKGSAIKELSFEMTEDGLAKLHKIEMTAGVDGLNLESRNINPQTLALLRLAGGEKGRLVKFENDDVKLAQEGNGKFSLNEARFTVERGAIPDLVRRLLNVEDLAAPRDVELGVLFRDLSQRADLGLGREGLTFELVRQADGSRRLYFEVNGRAVDAFRHMTDEMVDNVETLRSDIEELKETKLEMKKPESTGKMAEALSLKEGYYQARVEALADGRPVETRAMNRREAAWRATETEALVSPEWKAALEVRREVLETALKDPSAEGRKAGLEAELEGVKVRLQDFEGMKTERQYQLKELKGWGVRSGSRSAATAVEFGTAKYVKETNLQSAKSKLEEMKTNLDRLTNLSRNELEVEKQKLETELQRLTDVPTERRSAEANERIRNLRTEIDGFEELLALNADGPAGVSRLEARIVAQADMVRDIEDVSWRKADAQRVMRQMLRTLDRRGIAESVIERKQELLRGLESSEGPEGPLHESMRNVVEKSLGKVPFDDAALDSIRNEIRDLKEGYEKRAREAGIAPERWMDLLSPEARNDAMREIVSKLYGVEGGETRGLNFAQRFFIELKVMEAYFGERFSWYRLPLQVGLMINNLVGRIGSVKTAGGKSAVFTLVFGDLALRGKLSEQVGELIVDKHQEILKYHTEYQPLARALGVTFVDGAEYYSGKHATGPKAKNLEALAEIYKTGRHEDRSGIVMVYDSHSRGFLELSARSENRGGLNEHLSKVVARGVDEADVPALSRLAFVESRGEVFASEAQVLRAKELLGIVKRELGLTDELLSALDGKGEEAFRGLATYSDPKPGQFKFSSDQKAFTVRDGRIQLSLSLLTAIRGKWEGKDTHFSTNEIDHVLRALYETTTHQQAEVKTDGQIAIKDPTGVAQDGVIDGSHTFNVAMILLKDG